MSLYGCHYHNILIIGQYQCLYRLQISEKNKT